MAYNAQQTSQAELIFRYEDGRMLDLTWSSRIANYADVDAMASGTKPLDVLLAGQPVGTWVVLDPAMSKILGAARTPAAAMRKAKVAPVASGGSTGKRPIMIQVPDPSMVCFF